MWWTVIDRAGILRDPANKIWVHYDPDRSSERIRPLDLARTSVAVGVAAGADDVSYQLSGAANPWGYADEPMLFKNELACVHLEAAVACQLLMRSPSVLELVDPPSSRRFGKPRHHCVVVLCRPWPPFQPPRLYPWLGLLEYLLASGGREDD